MTHIWKWNHVKTIPHLFIQPGPQRLMAVDNSRGETVRFHQTKAAIQHRDWDHTSLFQQPSPLVWVCLAILKFQLAPQIWRRQRNFTCDLEIRLSSDRICNVSSQDADPSSSSTITWCWFKSTRLTMTWFTSLLCFAWRRTVQQEADTISFNEKIK